MNDDEIKTIYINKNRLKERLSQCEPYKCPEDENENEIGVIGKTIDEEKGLSSLIKKMENLNDQLYTQCESLSTINEKINGYSSSIALNKILTEKKENEDEEPDGLINKLHAMLDQQSLDIFRLEKLVEMFQRIG